MPKVLQNTKCNNFLFTFFALKFVVKKIFPIFAMCEDYVNSLHMYIISYDSIVFS